MDDHSITRSFRRVASGDGDAAHVLWERFFLRLVGFARARNSSLPSGMVDEEDIALSALKSVCIGLRDGRYPNLVDRDSLWRLLVVIAARKSADRVAYETRGKRNKNRTTSVDAAKIDSASLTPSELTLRPSAESDVEYRDLLNHLLAQLRHDDLKQVALMKLDGYQNTEIAQRIRRSLATVERKLKTIRAIWENVA